MSTEPSLARGPDPASNATLHAARAADVGERDAPSLAAGLAASAPAPTEVLAVGLTLRRLREARGWSVSEVSLRLKFSARQLTALEAERWAQLPTGLPLRGLIRNYARLLETDAQVLLAALAPHVGEAASGQAQLASERASSLYAQDASPPRLVWGLIGLLILVVASALAAAWLLGGWPGSDEAAGEIAGETAGEATGAAAGGNAGAASGVTGGVTPGAPSAFGQTH